MWLVVFCNVTPCSRVCSNQHFGEVTVFIFREVWIGWIEVARAEYVVINPWGYHGNMKSPVEQSI